MPFFTICHTASKRILHTGECRESDLSLQAKEGETLLPGITGDPATHQLNAAGDGLEAKPGPTLEVRKATLLSRLADRRWQIETGGIEISGMPIRTDRESQSLLSGAVNLSNLEPELTVKWKTAAGSFVDLNAAAIQGAAIAVGQHIQACFAREADLCGEIEAIETEEELTALDAAVAAFWP